MGKKIYGMSLDLLLFIISIAYLFSSVLEMEVMKIALTMLANGILLLSIPLINPLPRVYAIVLYISGVMLLVLNKASAEEWLQSFASNMSLLVLLVLVPLTGIPINYGQYIESLSKLYAKLLSNVYRLYALTGFLSLLFSPVLTIAGISILKDLSPDLKGQTADKSVLTALSRTFGLTLSWTPYFASVIFILSLLNMEWIELVPFTLSFAFIAFLLGCLIEYKLMKRYRELSILSEKPDFHLEYRKIYELIFILVSIVLVTLFLYYFLNLSMTMSVSYVSMLCPLIWLVYLKQIKRIKEGFVSYVKNRLPPLKNEIIILMSVGFFGNAFIVSEYSQILPEILKMLTNNRPIALIALISILIIVIPITGVHPLVLATIFGISLAKGDISLSTLVISFIIFSSWSTSVFMAPFSAATLVVTRGTPYDYFTVSIRWNWYFGIICYFLIIVISLTMHFLGL